jgi:hypothetical protein
VVSRVWLKAMRGHGTYKLGLLFAVGCRVRVLDTPREEIAEVGHCGKLLDFVDAALGGWVTRFGW